MKKISSDLYNSLVIDYGYTLLEAKIIEDYASSTNYLQIIYSYGEQAIRDLVQFFESEEEYIECSKIKEIVFNYNKSTGTNIDLK